MNKTKKITILDTSIGTLNLGDEIIVDSVKRELRTIFQGNTMFVNAPTHEKISRYTCKHLIKASEYSFVAGTNLLRSNHNIVRGSQWKINILDAMRFTNVLLMGVGWGSYEKSPNFTTKLLYKSALTGEYFHSVRDNYTKNKLASIGIKNVLNTGCPTMWQLTKEHCMEIPQKKAKSVVFTLTDYDKNPEKDKQLIEILKSNYEKVYFWIQGSNDFEYVKTLCNEIEFLEPQLVAFDNLLESDKDIEYVGTRLHAGIRALQKKRRSIIIGIDNRAIEKQKDFNINVINREDINQLDNYINGNIITDINLDLKVINDWKNQFNS